MSSLAVGVLVFAFMVSISVSSCRSKERRMRAAAVRTKLWATGEKKGSCTSDEQLSLLVSTVSEMKLQMASACIYDSI